MFEIALVSHTPPGGQKLNALRVKLVVVSVGFNDVEDGQGLVTVRRGDVPDPKCGVRHREQEKEESSQKDGGGHSKVSFTFL